MESDQIILLSNQKFLYDSDRNMQKIKEHCYFTGKFRDKAHSICNFRHSISKEISVIMCNGSNHVFH